MIRHVLTALLTTLPALAAWAQVQEDQGAVDLEKGIVLRQQGTADLGPGKDGIPQGVTLKATDTPTIALSEFSFTCTLQIKELPRGDHPKDFAIIEVKKQPLFLSITPNGSIMARGMESGDKIVGGTPDQPLTGRKIALAVSIKPDARQSLSSLWIDGVERASFNTAAKKMELVTLNISGTEGPLQMTVSDVRLYNRALTRPEVIELTAQSKAAPTVDTLALLGSTEAVVLAESGWLESWLVTRQAELTNAKPLALRDLAWEGDTVWRRDRPLNFGALDVQLANVQAQRVMLLFGRQECLEHGAAGVEEFRTALAALLKQCPPKAVIVGPAPFEKKAPPLPDLSAKNADLARYNEALQAVAQESGATFINVLSSWPASDASYTRDGLNLNENGTRTLAQLIATGLGSSLKAESLTALRPVAQAKQKLWHQYWRPSNWAFLYGDRTTQPSSRDHLNPSVRWFPQELEQYRVLIAEKENELWKLSAQVGRKLP